MLGAFFLPFATSTLFNNLQPKNGMYDTAGREKVVLLWKGGVLEAGGVVERWTNAWKGGELDKHKAFSLIWEARVVYFQVTV